MIIVIMDGSINIYSFSSSKLGCDKCGEIIYKSLFGILLGIDTKSKDSRKSRKDLKIMKIKSTLWPKIINNEIYLPTTPYNLSKVEK